MFAASPLSPYFLKVSLVLAYWTNTWRVWVAGVAQAVYVLPTSVAPELFVTSWIV